MLRSMETYILFPVEGKNGTVQAGNQLNNVVQWNTKYFWDRKHNPLCRKS